MSAKVFVRAQRKLTT